MLPVEGRTCTVLRSFSCFQSHALRLWLPNPELSWLSPSVLGKCGAGGGPGHRSLTKNSSDDPQQGHGDVLHSVTLPRGESWHVLPERISSAWEMASTSLLVQTDQRFMLGEWKLTLTSFTLLLMKSWQ